MKNTKIIAGLLGIFLFVAFIIYSLYVGFKVFDFYTHVSKREQSQENIKNYLNFAKEDIRRLREECYVTGIEIQSSKYKHKIPAVCVKKDGNSNIAVLIHGIGGGKEGNLNIAQMFLRLGFDVIAYDQRNSGQNMADYNTFGILESFDALDVVEYANSITKGKIALWGESYGGATACIALGRDESKIDYLILDCPLSSGEYLLKKNLKAHEKFTKLSADYMFFVGDLLSKINLGFWLGDSDVCKWMSKTNVPTLIFNSKIDTVTPEFMAKDIFNSIHHENKELVSSEISPHCQIDLVEEDLYFSKLKKFLKR